MAKLQQFSFVCAPSMAQYGGVAALKEELTSQIEAYRRKRDMVVNALSNDFELACPEGAFYAFPRAPWGTGTEFVAETIKNNVLVIPGNVFSTRDTHFRISYAVDDATLSRGLDVAAQRGAPARRCANSSTTTQRDDHGRATIFRTGVHRNRISDLAPSYDPDASFLRIASSPRR